MRKSFYVGLIMGATGSIALLKNNKVRKAFKHIKP